MDKKIDSKIYVLVEHRKTLWAGLIVLLGGISGLLLTLENFSFNVFGIIKLTLLIIGFVFLYILFDAVAQLNRNLNNLLK